MNKKFLFIQPFYFYGGHFFQSFNNLIGNLKKYKNFDFLVSINKSLNSNTFKKDFDQLNKKKKIITFKSAKKSDSRINVVKAFFKVLLIKKDYDVIFFYDVHVFLLSYLYLIFSFLLKKKLIVVYLFYGPEILKKSMFKSFFFKQFINNKNVRLFLRTKELTRAWQKQLINNKCKINYLKSLDYPNIKSRLKNKTGQLKFGSVGQIRQGKSLSFLNNYFKKNKKFKFYVIGGYANDSARKYFEFLNKSFTEKKIFLSFNYLVKKVEKLDYIVLLYDKMFDKRNEVSTLFLAARMGVPVICFKQNDWLFKKVKKYKCGMAIESLDNFKNFPLRNSKKYKSYVLGLDKFENENFNNENNVKHFYKSIINN